MFAVLHPSQRHGVSTGNKQSGCRWLLRQICWVESHPELKRWVRYCAEGIEVRGESDIERQGERRERGSNVLTAAKRSIFRKTVVGIVDVKEMETQGDT